MRENSGHQFASLIIPSAPRIERSRPRVGINEHSSLADCQNLVNIRPSLMSSSSHRLFLSLSCCTIALRPLPPYPHGSLACRSSLNARSPRLADYSIHERPQYNDICYLDLPSSHLSGLDFFAPSFLALPLFCCRGQTEDNADCELVEPSRQIRCQPRVVI